MFKFSTRSENNLAGVHPQLVKIVRRALELSPVDFAVIEGVRTRQRQAELYDQGRTKPGNIVTWTMNSRHFVNTDTGYGHAVDILPATGWGDFAGFDAVNKAMQQAASECGAVVRWGADWDQDGNPREKGENDSPHWELVADKY